MGFEGKHYFFTFIDNCTRITKTYTGTKKSDWLKSLKMYHSLCRTQSKEKHPIECLRSDYESKLQSHKANDWIQKKRITFEPFAPYSQKQNGISKQMGRIIIDMTKATILEGNINDKLWLELILTMTYVKNNRPTKVFQNLSPYEVHSQEPPNLIYL